MILVDSSVWIRMFRSSGGAEIVRMDRVIDDAATCGVILQEVLQGIQPEHYVAGVRRSLLRHYYLETTQTTYLAAAEYGRKCRARGFCLATADALIAAVAIERRAALWTLDKDFVRAAGFLPLRLHPG